MTLADWRSEGLRAASTVRLSRLDCLEQILLRCKLGALSANDARGIKDVWENRIQLCF
jgi:mRNA interferase MazF